MNHLGSALWLLYMAASWMMGVMPYLLAIGHQLLLFTLAILGINLLPEQPILDKEESYLTNMSNIIT